MASRRGVPRRSVFVLLALVAVCHSACSQPTASPSLADPDDRAAEHIEEFAAAKELFDGPGSEGEVRAMQYAQQYFDEIGLDTVVQSVPLVRMIQTSTDVYVRVPQPDGAPNTWALDGANFVVWAGQQQEQVALSAAPVVFAGYGIVSPEYTRDDFKGVDVDGKIVLVLQGSPHTADRDDLGALGEAYYGRPFYKFEEASRQGAAGVIIIHDELEPWDDIRAEFADEVITIEDADAMLAQATVEGWLSRPAARSLLEQASLDLDHLSLKARQLAFQPTELDGVRVDIAISSTIERATTQNVIALQRGELPEWVMLGARWNGLPTEAISAVTDAAMSPGESNTFGDGSAAAAVMEIARRLVARFPPGQDPRRGIVYTISTALAPGMVGLRYFSDHPSIPAPGPGDDLEELPLDKTRGHIFLDHAAPGHASHAIGKIGTGSGRVLSHMIRSVAIQQRRLVVLDQSVERRFYYSYSQSAFARHGVPTLYLTTPPDHEHLTPVQADAQTEGAAAAESFNLDASLLVELLTMMANTTHFPRESPPLRP